MPTAEPALGLNAVLTRIDAMAKRRGTRYSVYVLARYWYELDEFRGALRDRYSGLRTTSSSAPCTGPRDSRRTFVVVVGLEAGRNGFPPDKPVDSFQEMFLPPKEAFPFAEERRLFYVALTRARHRVYLLFDAVSHSPFIRELTVGWLSDRGARVFG